MINTNHHRRHVSRFGSRLSRTIMPRCTTFALISPVAMRSIVTNDSILKNHRNSQAYKKCQKFAARLAVTQGRRKDASSAQSKSEPSESKLATADDNFPRRRRLIHRKKKGFDPSTILAGSIYKPPAFFLGDDVSSPSLFLPENDTVLEDSIGSCMKIDSAPEDGDYYDTGMQICFLGTGSGSPECGRSTSAILVKLADGQIYLFDAGEGVQRQLQFLHGNVKLNRITKIFITHLHADHIFGLPGLLLSMQQSHKPHPNETGINQRGNQSNNEEKFIPTLKIYGPPGLFNYLASSLTLSCSFHLLLNVEVYELIGGRVRNGNDSNTKGSQKSSSPLPPRPHHYQKNPYYSDYEEYSNFGGRLKRFRIEPNNRNGTGKYEIVWDIQDFKPWTEDDVQSIQRKKKKKEDYFEDDERIKIQAAEVDHKRGVATFGFVVTEDDPPFNLDVVKAKTLGVMDKNNNYNLLRHGFPVAADMNQKNVGDKNHGSTTTDTSIDVETKDESKEMNQLPQLRDANDHDEQTENLDQRIVYPHEVMKARQKKRARKIAFIGDNRGWSDEMTHIANNADVLIHEATLLEQDNYRGHSTATMAGKNGLNCNAKLLVLNHISPKMETLLDRIVREAYDASNESCSVLMSFDFMQLSVPWLGYSGVNNNTTNIVNETMSKKREKENKNISATNATRNQKVKKILDWAKYVFDTSNDSK